MNNNNNSQKTNQKTLKTIPFVDNFEFLPFQKATHLWLAGQNKGHQLSHNLLLCLVRVRCIPLLQPQLALPAKQQHKLHLQTKNHDCFTPVHVGLFSCMYTVHAVCQIYLVKIKQIWKSPSFPYPVGQCPPVILTTGNSHFSPPTQSRTGMTSVRMKLLHPPLRLSVPDFQNQCPQSRPHPRQVVLLNVLRCLVDILGTS